MQVLRSSVRAGVATGTISLAGNNIAINSCQNKFFTNVLVVCQRSVTNNPLGGENAEYCAILARTNAKGKLSSVNLRKRHQRMLLRQAAKQPLHIPSSKKQSPSSSSSSSSENNTISLEVVKKELEQLIKRNRIYTNRRAEREKLHTRVRENAKNMREHNAELTSQESGSNNDNDNLINKEEVQQKCNVDNNRQPVMHNITYDNTKHDVGQSDILSAETRSIINDVNHLECEEQQQELHYCSSRQYEQFEDEEQEKNKMKKKNNNRGVHSIIDYSGSKESESENYHNNHHTTSPSLLAEVSILNNFDKLLETKHIDKEITVTSIDNSNSSNNTDKLKDMTSCSDTQQYERDMEHHFAISPQCTIFGTDLDRLEYDMMREFHQCGEKMPKIDSAYSTFGANRRGRRLRWEPSSSFDMINAAATSSSANSQKNNNNSKSHQNNKYHMSPLHMYAEAYAKEQEERAKARIDSYGSNHNKCMGVNYCKGNIASRCNKTASQTRSECHSANNGNSEIATSYNNTNVDQNEKEEEDLPPDANPHFPCESTSNDLESSNSHASSESIDDNYNTKINTEYKNSNNNYECKSNTSHELNKEDLS